jgi:hypothetical protein
MHLLATGDADDVRKLKESNILSEEADIDTCHSARYRWNRGEMQRTTSRRGARKKR